MVETGANLSSQALPPLERELHCTRGLKLSATLQARPIPHQTNSYNLCHLNLFAKSYLELNSFKQSLVLFDHNNLQLISIIRSWSRKRIDSGACTAPNTSSLLSILLQRVQGAKRPKPGKICLVSSQRCGNNAHNSNNFDSLVCFVIVCFSFEIKINSHWIVCDECG